MKTIKCENCGASVQKQDAKQCDYCMSAFIPAPYIPKHNSYPMFYEPAESCNGHYYKDVPSSHRYKSTIR